MPIYWQVRCTYCIHFCIVFFAVNCKLYKYCDFYVVNFLCLADNSDFVQRQHNHYYCLMMTSFCGQKTHKDFFFFFTLLQCFFMALQQS